MALKVSELATELLALVTRVTKIKAEVEALKNALANSEIPADAETHLGNLKALVGDVDDINPDSPAPEPTPEPAPTEPPVA